MQVYIDRLRRTLPEEHEIIPFLESDAIKECTLPSQVLDLISSSDNEKHWLVIAMNEFKFDVIARSMDTVNENRLYKSIDLSRHINRFRDSLDRIRLNYI